MYKGELLAHEFKEYAFKQFFFIGLKNDMLPCAKIMPFSKRKHIFNHKIETFYYNCANIQCLFILLVKLEISFFMEVLLKIAKEISDINIYKL